MAQAKLETADDVKLPALYTREIQAARKELEKFWTTGDKVVKRYLDKRDATDAAQWFNLFWSNTNILKATLYAKQPKADVSRRHKDPNDDIGRVAGEMIERILNLDMDDHYSDVDIALRNAIEDRLIPGLGQVWMRYEPTFVKQPNPDYAPGMLGEDGEELEPEIEVIGDERVATDYVYWKDFLWSPARTWREVRWVARGIYMTRSELRSRWPKLADSVPLNASKAGRAEQSSLSPNDPWSKALVWEIWNKTQRKVCWYVEGCDFMLGEEADPLQLLDFFPCPCPLAANLTTSAFVPKADYEMLRDQYVELDVVSARIALLEDAIRVVGVYDKSVAELGRMLSPGANMNTMVPADNWAMFAEKGGIKGSVDWFPIDMVVECLNRLREAKTSIMHDLYELTGLSDIMRGATVASETLGAQQLKAQYGSVRLQFLQGTLAGFVQQSLAIKAEIMASHFQPETLKRKSLVEFTPDAVLADQAIARLKDKTMMAYSLKVDPDTMALADYAQEQEQRVACITAIGQFMQAAWPLVQAKPEATPFLLQVLQWLLAAFKAGKQIEGVLDQAIRQISAQPQGPDPEQKAMQQASLRKVQSEGSKNESAAIKNIAEARTKSLDSLVGVADTVISASQPPAQQQQPQQQPY